MKTRILRALALALVLVVLPVSLASGAPPPLLPFDCTADLYVLDAGSKSILRIAPGGAVDVALPEADIVAATGVASIWFRGSGCAFDASGDLYFAVQFEEGGAVLKWRPGGTPSVLLPHSEIVALTGRSDAMPLGLAFGSDGFLYVNVDPVLIDYLLKVDPTSGATSVHVSAAEITSLPGITSAHLQSAIVGAEGGLVYVASDANPQAVFSIDGTGTPSVLAQGSPFFHLHGFMTRAPNGDLIIPDSSDDVHRVTPAGSVSLFLSESDLEGPGCVNGEVELRGGVAFDDAGSFYVAEAETNGIFVFDDALQCSELVSATEIQDETGEGPFLLGGIAFAPCPRRVAVGGVTLPRGPAVFGASAATLLVLVCLVGVFTWRARRRQA